MNLVAVADALPPEERTRRLALLDRVAVLAKDAKSSPWRPRWPSGGTSWAEG